MNRKSKRIAATETGSNSGHTCKFEVLFLPSARKPKAIDVVFDQTDCLSRRGCMGLDGAGL
jgi:hypothetical protein